MPAAQVSFVAPLWTVAGAGMSIASQPDATEAIEPASSVRCGHFTMAVAKLSARASPAVAHSHTRSAGRRNPEMTPVLVHQLAAGPVHHDLQHASSAC